MKTRTPVNTKRNSDGDRNRHMWGIKSIIPLHDYMQGLALIEIHS